LGKRSGLTILCLRNLSTRPWIAAPSRIHGQSCGGVESLWPGQPDALCQSNEPGKIMRIWKSDPTLHQHCLETLFNGLLGMKTERCQEDIRHLPLRASARSLLA
jgi:hypothetical protein